MRYVISSLAAAALLAACAAPASAASAGRLVVYCGRSKSVAAPVFAEWERQSGIHTELRYASSAQLQSRLSAEGEASPADLLWFRDAGYLAWLADSERLEPLPAQLRAGSDPRFHDREGFWLGISGRMRVLVANKNLADAGTLPDSLAALADEEWKGHLGWVPGSEGFVAHISALRHLWGNSETRSWLQRMKELKPLAYEQDSDLLEAIAVGRTAVGWTDYAAMKHLMKPGMPLTASSFAEGDAGNVLLISGAAVRKGTPRKREALRALSFLLGKWTQSYLAERAYEYPARSNIAAPDRFSLAASFHPTFVGPRAMVDLLPTRVMLQGLALP